jgi:hypothetical protein
VHYKDENYEYREKYAVPWYSDENTHVRLMKKKHREMMDSMATIIIASLSLILTP